MKSRTFATATIVLISTTLLLVLVAATGRARSEVAQRTSAIPLDAPIITQVDPSSAPNDLDTTIIITGIGFTAEFSDTVVMTPPVVYLGNVALSDVSWITSTTLTATVPWGMNSGIYTITVSNPNGEVGSLTNAFSVTQAVGVWTTDGPYGGSVHDIAVSPVTSQTAFAIVSSIGLFRTEDGGDNWNLVHYDPIAWGVTYGIAPTDTLYFWGLTGLWSSYDEGLAFQRIFEGDVTAFAPDPRQDRTLWVGIYPHGVLYSTNGGISWEARGLGLPDDAWPATLVIDPTTDLILYAVLSDGRVFKTTNTGVNWTESSNGLPTTRPAPPYTLAIHPFAPNVLLYSHFTGPGTGYRSTDGGETWSQVYIDPSLDATITDLAFAPHISGTVYASWGGGNYLTGISTDGGATWLPVALKGREDSPVSIALDPTSGLPAYLGKISSGVKRSRDGGQTWDLATYGITGLPILDIAAVSGRPETVFVANHGAGGFASDNAGYSWRQLDLPYSYSMAVVIDPQYPDRIYISPGRDIFHSLDGGTTWENIYMPNWRDVFMETLAIVPTSPSIIYAGGRDNEAWVQNESIGVVYRSEDYAATWMPVTFTQPISAVSDIAVNPVMSNTIYVVTGKWTNNDMSSSSGKGVFRSLDGGETWQQVTQGMGNVPVYALAIHPDQPQTIYASAWLSSEERLTVFKSTNGGDTWTPTSLRADPSDSTWATPLIIDPLDPETLYAGAANGLFRSTNGGTTWTRAAGNLGQVPILALAAASFSDRTIIYVGTYGRVSPGVQTRSANTGYAQGGVYKQTIDHRPPVGLVYLPLIMRNR